MRSRVARNLWAACFTLVVLGVWTALSSLPASGQGQEYTPRKPRNLEGQVRIIGHGSPPPDTTVSLESADGVIVAQCFVGDNGRYRFEELTASTYRLIVTAKGYQTATQNVNMDVELARGPTIYLAPVNSQTRDSPTGTTTDLAAPKQARKEYEKGSRLLRDGKLAEARTHLEKAVTEDPCYARAQTALGETLTRQSQFAAAESAFNQSIKCDGQFLDAYVLLAVLLNTEQKYKKSAAALELGLRRFPNEWRLYYQLGLAEVGSGNYEQAEKAYLKAQEVNPQVPPEFHLRLAGVYLKWKKHDKAYTELRSYVQADPHGRMAEPARKMLLELETSGAAAPAKSQADPAKP
ncbi:MAG: tetratricopeptide repeat protein [Acidobacteriia bacterium]|nr:tetratricopeptide repeat protein [Terriglobia bacterium]